MTSGSRVAELQPVKALQILGNVTSINQISFFSSQNPSGGMQELLWGLVRKCGNELSEDQETRLYNLLLIFSDVFASS